MLECIDLRLVISCSGCRLALPVNGVTESVRCYHCAETTRLDEAFWKRLIDAERVSTALAHPQGEPKRVRIPFVHGADLYYGNNPARCQACSGPPLDLPAIIAASAAGKDACFCPGCGVAIRLRVPDALVKGLVPKARLVVHESTLGAEAQAIQAKTTPIVFACMKCGGGLDADGTQRTVTCKYCNVPNYLPDGLWQQLRPIPKAHTWFVVVGFEDAASKRRARWGQAEVRRADAAGPGLTPQEYDELAGDSDDTVRHALAGNRLATPHALHRVAASTDRDARRRVAANPAAAPETLAMLAADDDDDIVLLVVVHPHTPATAVAQLATHTSKRVRMTIAQHPAVTVETLHALRKDPDDDVEQAAKARLEAMRAQGVDVDAGRGFFDKLFD